MNKISVIVPIYNSEKYLKRCLDSIVNQSYRNLDIILVNDGSEDSSADICEMYRNQDTRIQVIHKSNGGQSQARNRGLEIAKGEYISFVDSDDWINNDIYEHCINILEEDAYDVVDFKCVFVNGDVEPNNNISGEYKVNEVYGDEILNDYLFRGQTEKSPFSPCRKIYKRYLFEEIRFPEGKINEDIVTNYKVLSKCNKLIHTDKVGYYYFQNSLSTTRGGLKRKDFDLLDACKELNDLSRETDNKSIIKLAEIKYARSYFSLLAKIAFYGVEDETLDKTQVIRELTCELRRKYFILMNSPMGIDRKIMITLVCMNINLLSIPLKIVKFIGRQRRK